MTRRGFTLVEMLVVIGIILLLMGILLPAINRAYVQSVRSRIFADLQSIGTALEAYKQDFGDIPRVVTQAGATNRGDSVLCRALIAPGNEAADGADGPGFRIHPRVGTTPQGKVFGPYLSPEKFKYDPTNLWILDRNGKRILYFPGNKSANTSVPGGYIAAFPYTGSTSAVKPMYNTNDIDMSLFDYGGGNAARGLAKFQALMGCEFAGANAGAAGPSSVFTGEYLLWSAGPDEKYGLVEDPSTPAFSATKCDDVANFPR